MADEVIVCADCRSEFSLTESEASFFAVKGLSKPRRCKLCRQKRRDAKAGEAAPAAALPPTSPRGKTQWVGGGEAEPSRRDRGGHRDRKRSRYSDDSSF